MPPIASELDRLIRTNLDPSQLKSPEAPSPLGSSIDALMESSLGGKEGVANLARLAATEETETVTPLPDEVLKAIGIEKPKESEIAPKIDLASKLRTGQTMPPAEAPPQKTGPAFTVAQTVKNTAADLGGQFRRMSVYFYSGLAGVEQALITDPVATAFDFYAEKAGLKDPEKTSFLRRLADDMAYISELEDEAIGPMAGKEPITAAVARGAGGVSLYVPLLAGSVGAKLGIHALPVLNAFQAAQTGDPEEIGKAIVKGYVLVGALGAAGALPQGFRAAGSSVAFAGITAAEGGDLDQTIASAVLGFGLSVAGKKGEGRKVGDLAKDAQAWLKIPKNSALLKPVTKAIGEAYWYRKLTIHEKALATQRIGKVIKGLKATGMEDHWIMDTIRRNYGVDNPQYKAMFEELAVRTGRVPGTAPKAEAKPPLMSDIKAAPKPFEKTFEAKGKGFDLNSWAKTNPEQATALAKKTSPSRKDFKLAGLPEASKSERVRIANDLRALTGDGIGVEPKTGQKATEPVVSPKGPEAIPETEAKPLITGDLPKPTDQPTPAPKKKIGRKGVRKATKKTEVKVVETEEGMTITSPAGEKKAADGTLTGSQQKKYLAAELDQAIKAAPDKPVAQLSETKLADIKAEHLELRSVYKAMSESGKSTGEERQAVLQDIENAHAKWLSGVGTVTIEVPGDGTFEIINSKEALKDFQKRAKKFPVNVPGPDYGRRTSAVAPKSVLKLPDKAPTATAELEKAVSFATSKDETRAVLMQTHVEGKTGEVIATDGRRLSVALGPKGKTTKHMVPETEQVDGKSVPTGKLVEATYPNFKQVIPGYREGSLPDLTGKTTAKANTGELIPKINQVLALTKDAEDRVKSQMHVYLYQMPSGAMEIGWRHPDVGEYQSAELEKGKLIMSLNPEFFADALTFARRMGNEEVTLAWEDELSPILIVGEKDYSVQMPMRTDAEHPFGKKDAEDMPVAEKKKVGQKRPAKKAEAPPPEKVAEKPAEVPVEAEAKAKVPQQTIPEALHRGQGVVAPKGATLIRVTTESGGTALVDVKDVDVLKASGPYTKVEFGVRGKQGFVPVKGEAKVTPTQAPGGNAMAAAAEGTLETEEPTTIPPTPAKKEPVETPKELKARVKKEAAEAGKASVWDGVLRIVAPQLRSAQSEKATRIKRQRSAEAVQFDEVAARTLQKARKLMDKMTSAESLEFIDRMEDAAGPRKQERSELDGIAKQMRRVLDEPRDLLREFGILEEYYENYFPHLLKHPDRSFDVTRGLVSTRVLKPRGFLKKRKFVTMKDAVDAGFERAFENPVDEVLMRVHQMNRCLAGYRMVDDMKVAGFARFVPSGLEKDYTPMGFSVPKDPSFSVVAAPQIAVSEAFDKLLSDQLVSMAKAMGVSLKRVAKMRGKRWGESGPGKHITTKFAGPLSVVAHEIGHQIGDQYGLYDHLVAGEQLVGRRFKSGKKKGEAVKTDVQKKRATIRKELRALADLRIEEQEVTEGFKKYTRKKAEKEAVIMEAWLAAPEKMEKVAPTVTEVWKQFLSDNPILTPLLNMRRSVVLGTRAQTIDLKGQLTLGRWAFPNHVTDVIDNHLSRGLSGSQNPFVAGTYEGIRRLRNITLAMSHGLSAFHGINVGSDATASYIGIGLQKLSRGDIDGALKYFAVSPVAWADAYSRGRRLRKALRENLDKIQDPLLQRMAQATVLAGGRGETPSIYKNQSVDRFRENMRHIRFPESTGDAAYNVAAGAINALTAIVEATAYPIMQMWVPNLKLGVFHHLASDIYQQGEKHGWDDERLQQELVGAWDNVDNRMGELVYDNLNLNRMTKELMLVGFRAPGWTLGSIREFGGAAIDTIKAPMRTVEQIQRVAQQKRLGEKTEPGSVDDAEGFEPGVKAEPENKAEDIVTRKMGYAAGAAISYGTVGCLLTKAMSGKWPWDFWDEDEDEPSLLDKARDMFFPRTGRVNPDGSNERLSLPHYSKDIVNWLTDPVKTTQHKLNPLWGSIWDVYENADYFGTVIRTGNPLEQLTDSVTYFAKNMFIPFSVRNFFRYRENGSKIGYSVGVGLSGISPAPASISRTPAQKLMTQIMRDRGLPKLTKEESAERRERSKQIRNLRKGEGVDLSEQTTRQKKYIMRQAGMTDFQAKFQRLGFEDAMEVFTIGNTRERREAWEILVKKKSAAKDLSEDALSIYYELQLTQAQIDDRLKADVKEAMNTLYSMSAKDLDPERADELLERLKVNPQYQDDVKWIIAAFRTRWVYNAEGKRTGRRVGTNDYKKRLRRIMRILGEL